MHRLRRFVALLLLALWLPATLHCGLETAGVEILFVCHDHETEAAADHCADDACHVLEGTALKAFALTKLVSQAQLLVVALLPTPLELPLRGVTPARTNVPDELRRCWQFSTRAAPPARAPSALG